TATCLISDRQLMARLLSLAWEKTGKRMAARIAMIAITTSNSIKVKALLRDLRHLGCRNIRPPVVVAQSLWNCSRFARPAPPSTLTAREGGGGPGRQAPLAGAVRRFAGAAATGLPAWLPGHSECSPFKEARCGDGDAQPGRVGAGGCRRRRAVWRAVARAAAA